jgi:hypothetical protein
MLLLHAAPSLYSLLDVGFEILTIVVMKSCVFWDIKTCSLLKVS